MGDQAVAEGKKSARRRGALIVFQDESGFSLLASVRSTWAPRRQDTGAAPPLQLEALVDGGGARLRARRHRRPARVPDALRCSSIPRRRRSATVTPRRASSLAVQFDPTGAGLRTEVVNLLDASWGASGTTVQLKLPRNRRLGDRDRLEQPYPQQRLGLPDR